MPVSVISFVSTPLHLEHASTLHAKPYCLPHFTDDDTEAPSVCHLLEDTSHWYMGLMRSPASGAEAPQDNALILSDVASRCSCSNPWVQGARANHALRFGESKSEKLDHHHSRPSPHSFWASVLSALSWNPLPGSPGHHGGEGVDI